MQLHGSKNGLRWLAAALALALGGAGVAGAEPPPPRNWDLSLMVYGWAPKVEAPAEGTTTLFGPGVAPVPIAFDEQIDNDFEDVFDEFDFGAGARLDFRYWRIVGILDGVWVQSEGNGDFQGFDVDGYMTHVVADGKLGFRVVDVETPWGDRTALDAPRIGVDVLAGGRYWWSDMDLDIDGGPLLADGEYDRAVDWVDFIVGARLHLGLLPNLWLDVVGDVGGFDLWNASEFAWMVNPTIHWRPAEHISLFAGYKHLRADRERSRTNNTLDYQLSGPQIGIGFHF